MTIQSSASQNAPGENQTQECIEVEGLTFAYDKSSVTKVIDIPHWTVSRGERIFLYGPSGSGKSTLLNILAGILSPSQGVVRLLGTEFSQLSARKRDRFRAQHIGMVFQQFNLVPYLSLLENIQFAGHFARQSVDLTNSKSRELLAQLQLAPELINRRADSLSVGQQQRVAIVRALINQPEILIVDEPTSALDSDARDSFMSVLVELAEQQCTTLLFVSHDKSLATQFDKQVDIRSLHGRVC